MIWLTTQIGGDAEAWLRVGAPLLHGATALVLYRILSQHGMERSCNDYVVKSVGATPLRLAALLEPSPPDQPKYAGAILNLPYRIQAERAGLRCLGEAVDLMARSELLQETLGEHQVEWFLRNKRAEWNAYRGQVTPFELENYFPQL